MSGLSPAHRIRTKTSDLSEIFRSSSSNASRQALRPAPSVSNLGTQRSGGTETPTSLQKPKRSRIPFLGRKKTAEPAVPPLPASSKKPATSSDVYIPNTVPRSLGNGHTVLMISPPEDSSSSLNDVPLPSTLPTLNVSSPSLGSKFAAHFTPLRSPSKAQKARQVSPQKSVQPPKEPPPSAPPAASLSPQAVNVRSPSFESTRSSNQSRSSTPRPIRAIIPIVKPEEEDEFHGLFTLPRSAPSLPSYLYKPHPTPPPPPPPPRADSVDVNPLAPTSPTSSSPSTSPPMQFPVPPSHVGGHHVLPSRLRSNSASSYQPSRESVSSSNLRRQTTKAKSSRVQYTASVVQELESVLGTSVDLNSDEEQDAEPTERRVNARNEPGQKVSIDSRKSRNRRGSLLSGTGPSKASLLRQPSSFQLASSPSRAPTAPPSLPLPPPPSFVSSSDSLSSVTSPPSNPALPAVTSRKSLSALHPRSSSPRPRAMTMTAKSNSRHVHALPSSVSTPTVQTSEEVRHTDKSSAAIAEDLREALHFQRAQYDKLQNYLLTVTKKYEEEKTATDQTIEMLERDVRKKTREIEGLRWLVMHNGNIGDMGSVDHLTEQLDSYPDKREDKDAEPEGTDKPGSPTKLKRAKTLPDSLSPPTGKTRQQNSCISIPVSIQSQGLCIEFPIPRDESVSSLELPSLESSSAASSRSSLSLPALTPSTVSSGLSAIPEMPQASTSRPDRTSTANSVAEQQREKEERRASRALRRISTSSLASSVAMSTSKSQPISSRQPRPSSFGLSFEQPRSMEDVLERLKPFGST